MLRAVRFGIIGFGIFAEKRLVPGFAGSAGGKIWAISKRSIDDARRVADQHGIPHFHDDPLQVVSRDDIDAVYVASPNNLHAAHVVLAANHGKHVICEKPMAMNLSEAVEMGRAIRRAGVTFMVAQCYRWAGSVCKIKEIMASGRLGAIQLVQAHYSFPAAGSPRSWVFSKRVAGGGPTFDVGIHMIDTVRFLLDDARVVSASGYTRPFDHARFPDRDVEASGLLAMAFDNSIHASVSCSFDQPYLTEVLVKGTEAFLHARHFTILERDARIALYSDRDFSSPDEEIFINNGNFYASQANAFMDAVRAGTGSRGFPDLDGGLANQALLDTWAGAGPLMDTRGLPGTD